MDKAFKFGGYENNLETGELLFHYKLTTPEDNLEFTEKLILPGIELDNIPKELLNRVLDSLLLILGISYWKVYCPKSLDFSSVKLTSEQAVFWNKLYINGLGEFFYKNKIDFREFNLFSANTETAGSVEFQRKDRSLVGMGGGKDSIVSAELFKHIGKEFSTFTLTQSQIQEQIIGILGADNLSVERVIDPQLFELNKREDTYNGHIPISAIYHFVGILVAALYDFRYVVFSNEASANYGNVEYLGQEINHQWSKSFEFEQMLQGYVSKFITPDIIPFSLLRSMNEIKIAEVFSKYPKYFQVFSSCNTNFKINKAGSSPRWCGECAKCLFIFAMLAAFIKKDQLIETFGQNLFENESLTEKYQELLGIHGHKPFDCVGTPDEVMLAFYLASKKGEYKEATIMKMFEKRFSNELDSIKKSAETILSASNDNNIPEQFKGIAKA